MLALAAAVTAVAGVGTAAAAPVSAYLGGRLLANFGRLSLKQEHLGSHQHNAHRRSGFNRTEACLAVATEIKIYDDQGNLVGAFSFEMYQGIHLNAKGTHFTEYDKVIKYVVVSGTVPQTFIEFHASWR